MQRGHTLDGLGKYYRETITESDAEPVDVVAGAQGGQGRRARVLPAGRLRGCGRSSTPSARIDAGCGFVNALPVFIASTPEWAQKFTDAGLPIVGDDIKSQVGATITHRVLARLFEDRGVMLDRTYQLNVGGNMDFKNMLERDRLESKKISKTQSVTSPDDDHDIGARNVHIGPSRPRRRGSTTASGPTSASRAATSATCRSTWSTSSRCGTRRTRAGVIIDAVRAAKIAKDRGIGGPLLSASRYFMKSPPVQYSDDEAKQAVEDFIAGTIDR